MGGKNVVLPLAMTLAVQAMVSMAAVTVPVFALSASKDIGVSPSYIGIYVGLIYVACMVSGLLSGGYILRFGALRVSQMCLVLCGIGLSLTSVATIPMFVVSAIVIGLGYGPATPASSHILIRNTPDSVMSFVFSLKQTGVPLGGAMAGAVVPSLVLMASWKYAAMAVGISCLVIAVLIQPARDGIDRDRRPGSRISFKEMFRPLRLVFTHRPLLHLSIISFFFSGMQISLITYLVLYLSKNVGMSIISAGMVLATGQMAGSLGRIFWGILADRCVKPRMLLGMLGIGMSLCGVATALISTLWSFAAILLVIIFYGVTAIGWNGVYLAEAARLAPRGQVGVATGGTLFFTFLGVVIGPPFFAAIIEKTDSYPFGFVSFAVLTFIAGAMAILSRRKN